MRVKIYGAGSIGNHLAQASRRMGWDVVVVDPNPEALRRMKEEIYPSRYGAWDETIQLCLPADEPKGGFDGIIIGTPPDARMKVACAAIAERPKFMLLEKPLCTPSCEGLTDFFVESKTAGILSFVGYDHAVSAGIEWVSGMLGQDMIGKVLTLDVEFREHWGGIFNAHPWLTGPADTYLGYTERGGGASGEHSHALHLWFVLALAAGLGPWTKASGYLHMKQEGGAVYDDLAAFTLETSSGVAGRVVQDVVTQPTRKWARIQGTSGFIEWICNGAPDGDLVRWKQGDKPEGSLGFPKKRPDDFYRELQHIAEVLEEPYLHKNSPISIDTGLAVMEVLRSARGESLKKVDPLF